MDASRLLLHNVLFLAANIHKVNNYTNPTCSFFFTLMVAALSDRHEKKLDSLLHNNRESNQFRPKSVVIYSATSIIRSSWDNTFRNLIG